MPDAGPSAAAAPPRADAERPDAGRRNWAAFLERLALPLIWLAVVACLSVALPDSYPTWGNFFVMFASFAPSALLAFAIIVPLTADDYDLSVGATLTTSACVLGVANAWGGVPVPLAVLAALGTGLLIGLANAALIVGLRVPSLVATLGTTSLMTGFVQWLTNSSTIGGISYDLVDLATGAWLGLPNGFALVLLVGAGLYYVFDHTPGGRRLLFVGRGREVARLNGVDVPRVRILALVASAGLAALGGVLYAGLLGSADPSSGLNLLLPAFAAAFLGATAITPGRFNAVGTLIAVYFLASGITGLTMLGIPLWVTNVFNGGALIVAVALSLWVRRHAGAADDA